MVLGTNNCVKELAKVILLPLRTKAVVGTSVRETLQYYSVMEDFMLP